ncbi:hypothetical protein AMTR_s00113p00023020 [Amborella trichopoda]|uniref:Uncharacterized protein n=1 Tax=Amborella trichopoda TaxID=13333 RepID=W1NS91_AMBTC|nr:hypothetical protein AMTR_s00113p00023020 [Amborella trichopoda]
MSANLISASPLLSHSKSSVTPCLAFFPSTKKTSSNKSSYLSLRPGATSENQGSSVDVPGPRQSDGDQTQTINA